MVWKLLLRVSELSWHHPTFKAVGSRFHTVSSWGDYEKTELLQHSNTNKWLLWLQCLSSNAITTKLFHISSSEWHYRWDTAAWRWSHPSHWNGRTLAQVSPGIEKICRDMLKIKSPEEGQRLKCVCVCVCVFVCVEREREYKYIFISIYIFIFIIYSLHINKIIEASVMVPWLFTNFDVLCRVTHCWNWRDFTQRANEQHSVMQRVECKQRRMAYITN